MKIIRKFIRQACLPLEIYNYLINIASTLENIFLDEIILSKIQEATLNNMLKEFAGRQIPNSVFYSDLVYFILILEQNTVFIVKIRQ